MRKLFLAIGCGFFLLGCSKPKEPAAETVVAPPAEPAPVEFADPKYIDIGRKGIQAMSSGDIEAWMAPFSDNAKFYWSGGDSAVGKPAINEYWKKRRGEMIETITFSNDIFLAVKVNKPQRGPDMPGIWLFGWYKVNVKYKSAKAPISFWVHTDMHFDAADKVDVAVQYIDRVPIYKATGQKL